MCEIDCIPITGYQDHIGDITGISYDCCTNSLMISFGNCVVKTNKENGHSILLYKSNYMQITSVLSLCPNLVISGVNNSDQYVYVLDTDGTVENSYPVSYENQIKNILFNPCVENDDETYLDFFALKKGCYPYIFRHHLLLNYLPFQPDQCNFNICDECCCTPDCTPDECGDPCALILESIALVEAGIAHILNCEGEKLQKVLSESSDINAILAVNKEINNTISNVSQLEYLLYLKLNALVESGICDDFCAEDKADPGGICSDAVNQTTNACCVKKIEP